MPQAARHLLCTLDRYVFLRRRPSQLTFSATAPRLSRASRQLPPLSLRHAFLRCVGRIRHRVWFALRIRRACSAVFAHATRCGSCVPYARTALCSRYGFGILLCWRRFNFGPRQCYIRPDIQRLSGLTFRSKPLRPSASAGRCAINRRAAPFTYNVRPRNWRSATSEIRHVYPSRLQHSYPVLLRERR